MMRFEITKNMISVSYRCRSLKRCKETDENVCMRCKYCKAEMSAWDATRLLNKA